MGDIDTHGMTADFGKHRGEPYTRLPVPYLRWMVDAGHKRADIARAELERRGIPLVDQPLAISGHAIDSASLRCLSLWRKTRKSGNEGLNAWLIRMCVEAMGVTDPNQDDQLFYNGMKLVMCKGDLYWTLKTVMRDKRK